MSTSTPTYKPASQLREYDYINIHRKPSRITDIKSKPSHVLIRGVRFEDDIVDSQLFAADELVEVLTGGKWDAIRDEERRRAEEDLSGGSGKAVGL